VLDAIIRLPELFDRAKEIGYPALAVTDHGNMSQIYQAYKESKRTGVKLIPGNEIYFVEDLADPKSKRRHLVLLAQNHTGYKNLCRITYEGFKNSVTVMGREFPRVDAACLQKYSEGLFATSACGGSIIAAHIFGGDFDTAKKHALQYKAIFGDRFFIELQPHTLARDHFSQTELNNGLKRVAEETGIQMVATCDAHYLKPEHEKFHDMVLAIADKKALSDPTRHRYCTRIPCQTCGGTGVIDGYNLTCQDCIGSPGVGQLIPCPEFYLKSEDEVKAFFVKHYSEEFAETLILNTEKIGNACEVPTYLEPAGERLPKFDMSKISTKKDADDFLKWRAEKPARQEYSDEGAYIRYRVARKFREYTKDMEDGQKKTYWDRLQTELDILEARGFCSYMLIVSDFLEWAQDNDIWVGMGRGSAGSSLIGFFLSIHKIDPIKYGLLFERFQSRERKQCPDIDNDIVSKDRDRVLQYLQERWGTEHFAAITNVNRLTAKVAIKDIVRSMDLGGSKAKSFEMANAVTKTIPLNVTEIDSNGLEKKIEINSIELALKYSPELGVFFDQYPEVKEFAERIVGLPRSWGVHAGGYIVSDVTLPEYVPLRRDRDGLVSCHYDKNVSEEVGLIKIDILGLSTLDKLQETYENAAKIGISLPKPWEVPLDDQKVYSLITSGDVMGCFQLEGKTLAPLCKPMRPKSIEDIALINALGRPGIDREKRQEFIARRNGTKPVKFVHPILESIAKATLGISVYDEDLLRIAQAVAGWSLSKADGLRKLTKLKEKGAALAAQLEKDFVADAAKLGRVTAQDAQMIWNTVIADYAKYGFCLAADQEVLTESGPKRIDEIKSGEKVWSRDQLGRLALDPCVNVWCSGEKEVWLVSLEDGTQIKATKDHRFWMGHQWSTLEEIIKAGYAYTYSQPDQHRVLDIVSAISLGAQKVYDMEMPNAPTFMLPGGIVAHNCKAHSVAYSLLGYATAYYKYYARAPFLCAHLNSKVEKSNPEAKILVDEIKKAIRASGIEVRGCDINHSRHKYVAIDKKTIVAGLNAIDGLGEAAFEAIVANQPYDSFPDFIHRTPSCVNKGVVIALAKAGAFDRFGHSRRYIVSIFEDEKWGKKLRASIAKIAKKAEEAGSKPNWDELVWPELPAEEWDLRTKLLAEAEVLGEFVAGGISDVYPGFFTGQALTRAQIDATANKSTVFMEGLITAVEELKIKSGPSAGQTKGLLTLENLNREDFKVTVWPDQWVTIKHRMLPNSPIKAKFKINEWAGKKDLVLATKASDIVIWPGGQKPVK
jgi:DNA polymerase-3 subunit alpha